MPIKNLSKKTTEIQEFHKYPSTSLKTNLLSEQSKQPTGGCTAQPIMFPSSKFCIHEKLGLSLTVM